MRTSDKKTKENLEYIVKMYEQGVSIKKISEIIGIGYGTANKWLKEMNVKIRHKGPKSLIDKEDYFQNIDSKRKAYWLGFIMADGCISTYANQYSLKIHISMKDKILIDQFLKDIKSHNKTLYKPDNGNGSYYVSLTSKKMVTDLMKHGIQERKSGNEIFPTTILKKYEIDFIRGYFDGDGLAGNKKIGFIGSKKMLEEILNKLNIKSKIYKCSNTAIDLFYFQTSNKNNINIFFKAIYNNEDFCLKRKKDKIINILRKYRGN